MDPGLMMSMTTLVLPAVLVPTIIGMKQAQRKREWEHLERMRALELGRPLPGTDGWHALAATGIGVGVPASSFLFAWLASLTTDGPHHEVYWISAMLVSALAIVGSVALAWRMLSLRKATPADDGSLNGKPAFDPDAYDVVGQRG